MGLTYAKINVWGKDGSLSPDVGRCGFDFHVVIQRRVEEARCGADGYPAFRTFEGGEVERKVGEAVLELMGNGPQA